MKYLWLGAEDGINKGQRTLCFSLHWRARLDPVRICGLPVNNMTG